MATLDRLAPPPAALAETPAAWTPRRAIALALTAAAAIALLQVLQSSSVATTGETMLRLKQEKASRAAEIHRLEAEISALMSLDRIDRAARERLGMTPARNLEYVTVDIPAPSMPLLPRPLIEAPPAADQGPAAWWRSLLRALPLN
jgi:hypothetical protein